VKAVQLSLIVFLLLLFVFKGVLPSFSHIGTDFANYYTASWIALHARPETAQLYDQRSFGAIAAGLGGPQESIFQPFPPPTALIMTPLAMLPMAAAKDIWTVVSVLAAGALTFLLRQLGDLDLVTSSLILFGCGWALVNNVYLGQVYLMVLFCLALSLHFMFRGNDVLAGVLAGLFFPIKYFPLCLVALFVLERRWRSVYASVVTSAVVVVASVLALGWDIHLQFIKGVFTNHLDGAMANPFAPAYQSWNSLLRNLFLKDPAFNPSPLIDWPMGFPIMRLVVALALLWSLAVGLRNTMSANRAIGFRLALLFTFTLLMSPASASYHMLVLALPAAMIWAELRGRSDRRARWILAGSFFLVGLIPIATVNQIHFQGVWIVFAYPRLILLAMVFAVLVWLSSTRILTAAPEVV
jgi:hypothetical protein